MSDLPTSKQRGEVEFPCGHTVAHEEDCPRCEIERLQAELSILQDVHAVALDEIEKYKAWAASADPLLPVETDGHQRCEVQLLGTRCWREVDHTDTHRARVNGEWLDWMGSDEDRPAVEPSPVTWTCPSCSMSGRPADAYVCTNCGEKRPENERT